MCHNVEIFSQKSQLGDTSKHLGRGPELGCTTALGVVEIEVVKGL